MTSLHYILIGLGVAFVAILALYNHFQERRFRKQADRIFSHRHNDVVLGASLGDTPFAETMPDSRIEPTFRLAEEADQSTPMASIEPGDRQVEAPDAMDSAWSERGRHDPDNSLDGPAEAQTAPRRKPLEESDLAPTVDPESPLDVEIEYVARLRYAHPTSIVFTSLLESLSRISKPIRVVGRREDGVWELVRGGAARIYGTVELGLLLADRNGPVSEVQLDSFCNRLYEFVAEFGGAASCPDKTLALTRANELDAFCAGVDMLIGLNLVAPEAKGFSPEDVQRLAEAAGLVHGQDGRYSLNDPAGQRLFVLANNEADPGFSSLGTNNRTRSLSLFFDVPRVAKDARVFDRMTVFGQTLADDLAGRLVDDGGRPVSQESLDKDRHRLAELYARMQARGIPAGGERALRLFA